ncbi:hypothetical protein, partial [Geobacillus stearothermophilus]|nr:hypothetical protein [Geobacillus stearothermophilus]
MSEKELLAGRIETINKCFEQLVDTFNNFFQGVEIDETHTESFKEVQDQMKQFADDISTVQKQWVDYQLYLIDTANSMILDVPIVNCKLSFYFSTKRPFFCTFFQKALSPFLKECAKFF